MSDCSLPEKPLDSAVHASAQPKRPLDRRWLMGLGAAGLGVEAHQPAATAPRAA